MIEIEKVMEPVAKVAALTKVDEFLPTWQDNNSENTLYMNDEVKRSQILKSTTCLNRPESADYNSSSHTIPRGKAVTGFKIKIGKKTFE